MGPRERRARADSDRTEGVGGLMEPVGSSILLSFRIFVRGTKPARATAGAPIEVEMGGGIRPVRVKIEMPEDIVAAAQMLSEIMDAIH